MRLRFLFWRHINPFEFIRDFSVYPCGHRPLQSRGAGRTSGDVEKIPPDLCEVAGFPRFQKRQPGKPKENVIRNFEKGRIPRQLDLLARFLFDMEQN